MRPATPSVSAPAHSFAPKCSCAIRCVPVPWPQGSFYAHADVAPPAQSVKQNDDTDLALKEALALEALLEGAAEALSRGDNSRGAFTSLRARPRPPVADRSPAARPSPCRLQARSAGAGAQSRAAGAGRGRAAAAARAGRPRGPGLHGGPDARRRARRLRAVVRGAGGVPAPYRRPGVPRGAADLPTCSVAAGRAPRPSRARSAQAKRLRVNVGNIHFARGDFAAAVRLYRMAADALPPGERGARLRINRNVGAALLRMGQLTARPGAGRAPAAAAPARAGAA